MKVEDIRKGRKARRKSDNRKKEITAVSADLVTAVYHGPVFDDWYDIPMDAFLVEYDLLPEGT